jgi:hypothetical protein
VNVTADELRGVAERVGKVWKLRDYAKKPYEYEEP